jgi:hypothetical protein
MITMLKPFTCIEHNGRTCFHIFAETYEDACEHIAHMDKYEQVTILTDEEALRLYEKLHFNYRKD